MCWRTMSVFTTSFELVKLIMAKVFRGAPLAGLPMMALYLALLEWSRAAELTADRASACSGPATRS